MGPEINGKTYKISGEGKDIFFGERVTRETKELREYTIRGRKSGKIIRRIPVLTLTLFNRGFIVCSSPKTESRGSSTRSSTTFRRV